MEPEGTPQTAVAWVKANSKHTKSTRLVLFELAAFIDADNPCPSHKELAEITGLSKATVTHALGELEKDGTIASVKHGGDKKNGGKKNCYTLPGMTPVKPAYPGKVVDTKVNEHTPVKSVTLVENAEPVEYTDAPTHEGGDAAGEKDLSLRAKEKDKKPFSPDKTGESKKVPKQSIRAPRPRNPLFDAIAWYIFDFPPTSTEAINAAGGRIGEMLKDFPADKSTLTPERIAHFGRWWNANKRDHTGKSISKPLTAGKLATHWSDFERANPIKTAISQQAAQQREADNRRELEQEHRRQQLEMLGV